MHEKDCGNKQKQQVCSSFSAKEALLSGFQADPVPSWNEAAHRCLNRKRYHHCSVVLDENRILVVGGYEKSGDADVLRSVEVYDRRTKKWDKKSWPKLNQHRAEHAAAKVGNLLYVLGGRDANGRCLDSVECLDLSSSSSQQQQQQRPHAKQWVTLDIKLSSKKRGCTAVAVGTTVYVMGGKNDDSAALDHVDMLDTTLHKRYKGPSLKTPLFGCGAVLLDDTIYVVGGQDGSRNALGTMESLSVSPDDSKASWQTCAASLATPRMYPALTAVSHSLLVIGGRLGGKHRVESDKNKQCLGSVEVVDTKRNLVWPCVGLNQPLYGCTAETLCDSSVVVMGGCSKDDKPLNYMHVLRLEFASHETHVAAVEQELKEIRGSGGSLKKMFGGGGSKSNTKSVSKLKAYLKELKKQSSTPTFDDSFVSGDSSTDEIARHFENKFPAYDSGRIVAKKELKDSGQARVFKGAMRDKKGGKHEVAIKVFKSRKDWDDCKKELMTLLKISGHPNVMDVLDFFEVPMPAFVMRYVSGGDLRDHLDKKGKFSGKHAVGLLQGIGVGLRHLHTNAIVHRDLKSLNVLLEGKGSSLRPVLIDLGLGKGMPKASEGMQFQTRVQGTAGWMAPEMMSGKWSTKIDMYALGVIMWEVLTGASPYPGKNWNQIVNYVRNENGRPDKGQMTKAKVSQKHQELVNSLWDKDPSKRPSTDEFLARLK